MIRAYALLLRPTARQRVPLSELPRDHCSPYNAASQGRRDAYRHVSETTVRYGDRAARLKEIRTSDPERQGRWPFSSRQATPRRLEAAFRAFFRRVTAGQAPGPPSLRGGGHFDTVTFPEEGDGRRRDSAPHDRRTRVHQHRPVRGRVTTIAVEREGNRWHVVLACGDVPAEELPPADAITGIDTGTTHRLTPSEGEHTPNPRFLGAVAEEPAAAQRHPATFPQRTRQRAERHRAAARQVADLRTEARRQRLDHHRKTARALVAANDVIAHERPNTAGTTRSPAPRPDPDNDGAFLPNGAAAEAGPNRSVLDAGRGRFPTIPANKAGGAGRLVIPVDPRNTSRTCPPGPGGCGHVDGGSRVTRATFPYTACGVTANGDHVGAVHISDRAGLVLCDVAWPPTQDTRAFGHGWSHSNLRSPRARRFRAALIPPGCPLPADLTASGTGSGSTAAAPGAGGVLVATVHGARARARQA